MQSQWLQRLERLPIANEQWWIAYPFALLLCGFGLGVRFLSAPYLHSGYPFVSFFPSVIVTTFLFGVRPGIFATILSWLFAQYFFLPPTYGFQINAVVVTAFLFYASVAATQIAVIYMMQTAIRALRAEREKSTEQARLLEVMFRELQHRVSNKLQIVASLLTLQRRQIVDPDAKKALEAAALRVGMIGRIARALHDPERSGLSVQAFLEQVGHDILESAGAEAVTLSVETDPGIEFQSDSGVPIALIIAETISNALEHGFQSSGRGAIAITVRRSGEGLLRVTVADDGCGVPPGFDASQSRSLGLRIATTLATQLGGTFVLRPGEKGAVAELSVLA